MTERHVGRRGDRGTRDVSTPKEATLAADSLAVLVNGASVRESCDLVRPHMVVVAAHDSRGERMEAGGLHWAGGYRMRST